ncbi:exo-beta-N-acetylmuramidase NamZ family protein [Beutenbergia cavernae]|nr:DUF1343 domain-containing protein [Beutenbergia cavernae]
MPSLSATTTFARRTALVRTGLDRAVEDPGLLGAEPIAMVCNYTSVTADLRRGVDALAALGGVDIRAICVPEHGYWGAVQAGESEAGAPDVRTGIPIVDTYLVEGEALERLLAGTGAARIVLDLQDIGSRFYTYIWTMLDVMCAAANASLAVTVLDRPNPIGAGRAAGPGLLEECASFVGRENVPLVHGLTIGELARWFAAEFVPARTGREVALDVVAMDGPGDATGDAAATGMTWVPPSPNMPSPTTARLYPGTCLVEGTLLSEGRGTTSPFETVGAPWLDGRFADALAERELPGVAVREAWFRPVFSKHAGELCGGVQLHVTRPEDLDPLGIGFELLAVARRVAPDEPLWRQQSEAGRPPFADLLWGSPALRTGIDAGQDLAAVLAASPEPLEPPESVRLYPRATPSEEAGER